MGMPFGMTLLAGGCKIGLNRLASAIQRNNVMDVMIDAILLIFWFFAEDTAVMVAGFYLSDR